MPRRRNRLTPVLLFAALAGAVIAWPVVSGIDGAVRFRTAASVSGHYAEFPLATLPPLA